MSYGWNYDSSKEQDRAHWLKMYKSLTDPETKKELKIKQRRETRRAAIIQDTGL